MTATERILTLLDKHQDDTGYMCALLAFAERIKPRRGRKLEGMIE